jgi:hypothetical protein
VVPPRFSLTGLLAELWQLVTPTMGTIDITVPNGSGRRRNGLTIHHSHLPDHEIATQHGIAVTTPAEPSATCAV